MNHPSTPLFERTQSSLSSTRSGELIWFLHPERTEIVESDMAYALSNICRYTGHIKWSDLRHLALCVELSRIHFPGDKELAAYMAVHDMPEAYVNDIPTGLKQLLPEYQIIEALWQEHVHNYWGLPWEPNKTLHKKMTFIDRRALRIEMAMFEHKRLDHVLQKWEEEGEVALCLPLKFSEEIAFGNVSGQFKAVLWDQLKAAIKAYKKEMRGG